MDGLQILANGVIVGAQYALLALGFTIIYRTVRFFHLAHGAIYAVGAYASYTLSTSLGVPRLPAFALAALICGCAGLLVNRVVYVPLKARRAPNLVFLLASFGVVILVANGLQMLYGAQILSPTAEVLPGHQLLGIRITDSQLLTLLVCLVLFALLWWFTVRTRPGRAMRAVADDSLGASVVGISPRRITSVAFFMGSFLAGAAGALASYEMGVNPNMGLTGAFKAVVAAIVGGAGSLPGAILGGILLGLAENLGTWMTHAGWRDVISFSILIAFLLFRPVGILGTDLARHRR